MRPTPAGKRRRIPGHQPEWSLGDGRDIGKAPVFGMRRGETRLAEQREGFAALLEQPSGFSAALSKALNASR